MPRLFTIYVLRTDNEWSTLPTKYEQTELLTIYRFLADQIRVGAIHDFRVDG